MIAVQIVIFASFLKDIYIAAVCFQSMDFQKQLLCHLVNSSVNFHRCVSSGFTDWHRFKFSNARPFFSSNGTKTFTTFETTRGNFQKCLYYILKKRISQKFVVHSVRLTG